MTYTYSQLESLWIQAGGSPALAPLMAAIGMAESDGDPTAQNPSGASGLWQILMPVNAGYVPGGQPNVFNPQDNAKAAVAIYNAQGLDAWQTYTNGDYKKFYSGTTPASASASGGGNTSGGGTSVDTAAYTPQWQSLPFGNIFKSGSQVVTGFTGSATGIADVATSIGSMSQEFGSFVTHVNALFSPTLWLRVGAAVFGIILLILGVMQLTKAASPSAGGTTIIPVPV